MTLIYRYFTLLNGNDFGECRNGFLTYYTSVLNEIQAVLSVTPVPNALQKLLNKAMKIIN